MKVLVVTPYYHPKIGGLENYARQLSLAMHRYSDWEIVIATSNHQGRRSTIENIDGLKTYRLSTWIKISNTPFNPLWQHKLRQIIKLENPDLILAHSPVPSMADAAARAAGSKPFILVYHAATVFKDGSPIFNLAARIYSLYGQYSIKRADQIWAVSEFVRQQFSPDIQNKTVVMPNSIWKKEIRKRSQAIAPNFVFIGSLDKSHSWKGLAQIIQAFKVFLETNQPKAKLTVIGDGNNRNFYQQLVDELGLHNNVKFVGFRTGWQKNKLLRQATALIVYPTSANDAFPTVILEAWSKYVPVIAANIGPMPTILNNYHDSFLVSPNQPHQLAGKMSEIANLPKSSLAHLTDNAIERINRYYTWEQQSQLASSYASEILR